MKIAIYASARKRFDEVLYGMVLNLPPDADLLYVRSISALERHLRGALTGDLVIVLVPDPSNDMSALYRLQELLRGVRLVILLPPDCSTELLNCAHSLFPRYLCFQPDDVQHLGRILRNLCLTGTVKNHADSAKAYYSGD